MTTQPEHTSASARPGTWARRRRWWLTACLVAAVFLGGFVCGAGTAVVVIARRVRESVQHPERTPDRMTRQFTRRLRLSPDQAARVHAILKRRHANLLAIREEVTPRVRGELDLIESEIATELTAKQRETWHRMVGNFKKNWVPKAREPEAP
jgi:hypothetical protein